MPHRHVLTSLMSLVALLLVGAGPALAQSNQAQELALRALRLEFERDHHAGSDDEIEATFRQACERGYNPACRRAAWLVEGEPVLEKAGDAFRASCDAGDPVGCVILAWALDARAQKTTVDEEKNRLWRRAGSFLKQHCDAGSGPACHEYAAILYDNKGIALPKAEPAYKAWNRACDIGENAACVQLARLKRDGGRDMAANRGHARKYAQMACNRGYADGCYLLGRLGDGDWSANKFDEHYSGLCDQGHREACWYLARAYYDGRFTEPEAGRAQGLFEHACALKHARACYEAGRWELEIDGDQAKALRLFGEACEMDDAAGCSAQADMILSGKVEGTVYSAYKAFDVACEQRESTPACLALGFYLLDEASTRRDPARGRELLGRVCVDESSPPEACHARGRLHEFGIGGDQDRTEAANFYRWACAAGHIDSCMRRGLLLVPDEGIRADHHEALVMFGRACEADEAEGCFQAGWLLETSPYIKDPKKAATWYARGCDADHGEACVGWGRMLETREVGPDMTKAREAYEKSLTLDALEGKRRLARLLWNGMGGKKVRGRAKQLCRDACKQGDAVACRGPEFLK